MKIEREKRIRAKYVEKEIERVVGKMMKTVTGKGESEVRMGYRNICKVTGRSRGVISGKVRMEWRRLADKGEMEGVRRASW